MKNNSNKRVKKTKTTFWSDSRFTV